MTQSVMLFAMLMFNIMSTYSQASTQVSRSSKSAALYYGADIPIDSLSYYDQIIIESAQISVEQLAKLKRRHNEVYAYVSVGEFERWRDPNYKFPKGLFLKKNQVWNSSIIDPSHPQWHSYILSERIKPLVNAGYDGVFLDTLDSYKQAELSLSQQQKIANQLIILIKEIKDRHPKLKIMVNQAFDLLPKIYSLINGVVAESVFYSYSKHGNDYVYHETTLQHQQQWLSILRKVKDQYQLPVIVVDYVDQLNGIKAVNAAKKINDHGFIPWISNPLLTHLGVGNIRHKPRKIIMLYDSRDGKDKLYFHSVFTKIALILDYYGYVAEYWDISKELPNFSLVNRYAGIISWLTAEAPQPNYQEWLIKHLKDGIKVAIFEHLGVNFPSKELENLINIRQNTKYTPRQLMINKQSELLNFESERKTLPLKAHGENLQALQILENCQNCLSHISMSTPDNDVIHGAVSSDWGGWIQKDWILEQVPGDRYLWIIDPFEFLNLTLNLDELPAPDVTSQFGRRLLMVHIDGDGFLNKAEWPNTPYSSEIIFEEILQRFKLPQTISVVEGEIGSKGLYKHLSAELESIAKEIFKLPYVEPASHTYSHPFQWQNAEKRTNEKGFNRLKIPNYEFDYQRDLIGSMNYVDSLLPEGKKTKILLWTGDALPKEQAFNVLNEHDLMNLNGGFTEIRDNLKSHVYISPMYHPVGAYYQVLAPIMNEAYYTNVWQEPFYGYRDVIQTFRYTDKPKRLKPLSIYYHFFSGDKPSALNALTDVYEWALQQEHFPIYASDYINKVKNFLDIKVFETLSGEWLYFNVRDIHSFRLYSKTKIPSIKDSRGIIGYSKLHDALYIHVLHDDRDPIRIKFTELNVENNVPILQQSNADIIHWKVAGNELDIKVAKQDGQLETRFIDLRSKKPCQLISSDISVNVKKNSLGYHSTRLLLGDMSAAEIKINCH